MFYGQYSHSLDDKGRLIIPSKFRNELGTRFFVTVGIDRCLYAYPEKEWETIIAKLREAATMTESARKFERYFAGNACDFTMDKQGRINLPANLKDYAGISKDVISAGVLNRIELWDAAKWNDANTFSDMNEIAEQMASLGIGL